MNRDAIQILPNELLFLDYHEEKQKKLKLNLKFVEIKWKNQNQE